MQNLNGILKDFGRDDAWQEQQCFQRLLRQWIDIVGVSVAAHTRPTGIHRGVLQVAASSAVWAQNLSYERRRILQKIQAMGMVRSLQLKDIRFSTAEWHNRPADPNQRLDTFHQQRLWQQHPSRLPDSDHSDQPSEPHTQGHSQGSFQTWEQQRRHQNDVLPECPNCQCPTPPGELQRWSVCAFCATQQWQADKIENQRRDA